MKINSDIFREYDIRGIVDRDLIPETVQLLGKGVGTYFRRNNKRDVAIGRDCRLSSNVFFKAISKGVLSTGCNVIELGTIPTPLLYFYIYSKKIDAGVMITGSHNPPEYNGFKLMLGEDTLYGEEIQNIYKIIQQEDFIIEKEGQKRFYNIIPEYTDFITQSIKTKKKLKVVIDAGNGTAGVIAAPVFKKLGCEVIELFCEMDGTFPHHHPDPTLPEALKTIIKKVSEVNADVGLAYDGDGDRIGVIDDEGKIIWGDQLLILFSRDILPQNPGATVISEVKASKILYDEIENLGGQPIMWKAGHSLIKKKIKDEKALLAGEVSGHIFFADRYFGFDDAIYCSARLIEILSRSNKRLSQMLSNLPQTFNTPEIRIYASDEVKFKIVEKVKHELSKKHSIIDIDGVRAIYPNGWGLVRSSNTQECLVLRFEADTEKDLKEIRKEVEKTVEMAIKRLRYS